MATASQVLAIAASQIGYSRWDDPEEGTKYGRWYAASHGAYFGSSGVPFCAMGVSWTLDQAGMALPGGHVAYVPYAINNAKAAGRLVYTASALPGDAVCFDWDDDGLADHIGFVEINYPSAGKMQTIEFNTGDGEVARRIRYYSDICAIIRPAYDDVTVPEAQIDDATGFQTIPDGWWGRNTTRDLQRSYGHSPDAVISSQSAYWRSQMLACTSGWEWVDPASAEGSQLIGAMQQVLGLPVDYLAGRDFINALEAHYGFQPDSYFDGPSNTIAAMQRALAARGRI